MANAKKPTAKKAAVKKPAAKKKNVKKFAAPKSQDFSILDNSGVVGHLRIKPNAVAWKAKSSKGGYDQLTIEQFAALAAEHGRKVEK